MQQLEFKLNGEFIELNQLLKMVGVCDSGGAGKA
ncbi:MAG: RNA-binding S4 domain-containing protein, partial [Candidatus Nitrotoga sp.]